MKSIIKEFKEFAVKGNVFDMAVGIIIGGAFSKVVSSLVKDIIMPPIGYFTGQVNFSSYQWVIQSAYLLEEGGQKEEITINYGTFIENSFDFFIVAFSMFLVIRLFNKLKKESEDESNPKEVTPKNILLLAEIRDLLKEQKEQKSNQ